MIQVVLSNKKSKLEQMMKARNLLNIHEEINNSCKINNRIKEENMLFTRNNYMHQHSIDVTSKSTEFNKSMKDKIKGELSKLEQLVDFRKKSKVEQLQDLQRRAQTQTKKKRIFTLSNSKRSIVFITPFVIEYWSFWNLRHTYNFWSNYRYYS